MRTMATLAIDLGMVFLERSADGSFLLNTVTLERYDLRGPHPWDIGYDDEGFAYVFDPSVDDPELEFVDEKLRWAVYDIDGEHMFMECQRGPAMGVRVWLRSDQEKYSESTCTFFVGSSQSPMTFDVFALKWPRHGARVFIALKDVYQRLCFSQYGGESWRWIHASRKTWARVFSDFALPGHFQGSAQLKSKGGAHIGSGFLPSNCTSVYGLLLLACRWAFNTERHGGMKHVDHQQGASQLLMSVCSVAFKRGAFDLTLDLAKKVLNPWPRLQHFEHMVSLRVSHTGDVDLCAWRDAAMTSRESSFARKAFAQVASMASGNIITLRDLFLVLARSNGLDSILQQLVWAIGARVDALVLQSLQGKPVDGLTTKQILMEDLFTHQSKMDARLVRHVESCKLLTLGQDFLGICTDKASVGGFNLQASLMTLPSGEGLVPPPQALCVFRRNALRGNIEHSRATDSKRALTHVHITLRCF